MMNYFDKHFEGIKKNLQQLSSENAKIEDTLKFKHTLECLIQEGV